MIYSMAHNKHYRWGRGAPRTTSNSYSAKVCIVIMVVLGAVLVKSDLSNDI